MSTRGAIKQKKKYWVILTSGKDEQLDSAGRSISVKDCLG